ncbi:hypothetical protein CK203_064421 [Vitis vinifera]|uniref:Uncharacterized protein n=1 Tax=Vitis vinifera TaxID=29760 RepID=A0A438FQF6_VITVI|nr:hypothetical protein CK203_064421 [Vitis vinifera]
MGGGATRRPMGLSNHTWTANRKHSLRLAYGMNAVIPTEIGLPTIRTETTKKDDANAELGRNLDWADEVRESTAIRMADYQQRASAHYNRKQTLPLAPLFALPGATANPSSASFQSKPPSGVASPPPQPGHLILCLVQAGRPLTPPGSLPQPNPPEELHCPLERWINWLRPPPVSSVADLSLFLRRDAKAFM